MEERQQQERLQKQLAFALEIDKEKNILRQTHLSGHGRRENDAEHAWHMAIMAYLLREYANEEVDIAKVMLMCLIHDIVEIDAGDTYAYDEEKLKTQKAREDAAKERIFSILPQDQKEEMLALLSDGGVQVRAFAGQFAAAHAQRQQRRQRLGRARRDGAEDLRAAAEDPAGIREAVRGDGRDH